MKIKDLLRMAGKNLSTRKLRSFLTILGVVVGSISIIVMISLGIGMQEQTKESISQMGNIREIQVHGKEDPNKKKSTEEDMYMWGGGAGNLKTTYLEELKAYPHVETVIGTLTLDGYNLIVNNRYQGGNQVVGINPEDLKYISEDIEKGEFLTKSHKKGAMFGANIERELYDPKSTNYKQIEIDLSSARLKLQSWEYGNQEENGGGTDLLSQIDIEYVGTFQENQDWNLGYSIYMDIDFVRDLLIQVDKKQKEQSANNQSMDPTMGPSQENKTDLKTTLSSIKIIVDQVENVKDLKETLEGQGYQVSALTDILDSTQEYQNTINLVLGGIGAVSFLVAAIGISNTMIMSIQERTREIGVMKVIGASLQDIKRLFLIEAAYIGLIGGLIGIVLSHIISIVINYFVGGMMTGMMGPGTVKISVIPIWLSLLALIFSTFIGLASGYFPARRAMKLSALEAIRSN